MEWHRNTAVRPEVYSWSLLDGTGVRLLRLSDSTHTFRKEGDLAFTLFAGTTLNGEGQWAVIKPILVRLFPNCDLTGLELPARLMGQEPKAATMADWR